MKSQRDVQALIEVLGHAKDEQVRQAALEALGKIKDPRAVEPLIAALKDEDVNVRWPAARALGEIKDTRAIKPLIAALKDADWIVREAAAEALIKIGAPAVEPLIAALKERRLRWSAAEVLGKIGDARAVEPLSEALRDWGLRWAAAEALAKIGVPAVESLTAALKDEDQDVRWAAAAALISICRREKLEDKTKAALLTICDRVIDISNGDTKKSQAQEEVEKLIRALIHPHVIHGRVVADSDAIQALGALGDRRAWLPLITCLQDSRPVIRPMVLEALTRIDAQQAVPILIEALQDPYREAGKTAARYLVALYHESRLPDAVRQAILECRPLIVQHHDAIGQNQWGCHLHQDEGLGVEFPL